MNERLQEQLGAELDQLRTAGTYKRFNTLTSPMDAVVGMAGRGDHMATEQQILDAVRHIHPPGVELQVSGRVPRFEGGELVRVESHQGGRGLVESYVYLDRSGNVRNTFGTLDKLLDHVRRGPTLKQVGAFVIATQAVTSTVNDVATAAQAIAAIAPAVFTLLA